MRALYAGWVVGLVVATMGVVVLHGTTAKIVTWVGLGMVVGAVIQLIVPAIQTRRRRRAR